MSRLREALDQIEFARRYTVVRIEAVAQFATRIAGLRYAPLHEMIHCGQIAMIRRMLGQKPIW